MNTSRCALSTESLPGGYVALVEQIRSGNQGGIQAFYKIINRDMKSIIARQLRAGLIQDTMHDCFILVVSAIQKGHLDEPDALVGFALTIVQRQVIRTIKAETLARNNLDTDLCPGIRSRGASADQLVTQRERAVLMKQVLTAMSPEDRELLVRVYLHDQSPDQVCEKMALSGTQFRLQKSRAMIKFGKLGRQLLNRAVLYAEARKLMNRNRPHDHEIQIPR